MNLLLMTLFPFHNTQILNKNLHPGHLLKFGSVESIIWKTTRVQENNTVIFFVDQIFVNKSRQLK